MKKALVLVDIQNDYFKGGKNELYLPEQAAAQARKALDFFRQASMPVFHVRHISLKPGAAFFLPDSQGSEIYGEVFPLAEETVFIKHAPNSFLNTGLAEELLRQEVEHLVICGMMSHMCIDTTVRAAQNYPFTVTLLEDACTTKDLLWNGAVIPAKAVHNTFMASLDKTFAQVVKTEQFLGDFGQVN